MRQKSEEEKKAELDFETRRDDILRQLPEAFHPFVRTYSWEHGHASGYNEVLNIAEDLIWHLTRAVERYKLELKDG